MRIYSLLKECFGFYAVHLLANGTLRYHGESNKYTFRASLPITDVTSVKSAWAYLHFNVTIQKVVCSKGVRYDASLNIEGHNTSRSVEPIKHISTTEGSQTILESLNHLNIEFTLDNWLTQYLHVRLRNSKMNILSNSGVLDKVLPVLDELLLQGYKEIFIRIGNLGVKGTFIEIINENMRGFFVLTDSGREVVVAHYLNDKKGYEWGIDYFIKDFEMFVLEYFGMKGVSRLKIR